MIEHLKQQFPLKELQFSEPVAGFPLLEINNQWANVSLSLYGGQVLSFQPHNTKEPVLWLSDQASYQKNKAIRGGIPVCWPWFADDSYKILSTSVSSEAQKMSAHGFARTTLWQLLSAESMPDGSTCIVLHLPCAQQCQHYQQVNPHFLVDLKLKISIASMLKIELISSNQTTHPLIISEALHSYFNVSDIENVRISGLGQLSFIDKLYQGQLFTQQSSVLELEPPLDRIYAHQYQDVLIEDIAFARTIHIKKQRSNSTIVWNPGAKKTQQMSDMSDDSWRSMICVEAGNVSPDFTQLAANEQHVLAMSIQLGSSNSLNISD